MLIDVKRNGPREIERQKERGGKCREKADANKISEKGGWRLNVNLLLTITFYCNGCETLWLFVL